MEKVREALNFSLAIPAVAHRESVRRFDAALAEVEEWEKRLEILRDEGREADRFAIRAVAAEAERDRLKAALTVLAGWIPNETDTPEAMSAYAHAAIAPTDRNTA